MTANRFRFRYIYQHNETGRLIIKEFSLTYIEKCNRDELEYLGYSIVARLQSTGFEDKKGVEIYESDILQDRDGNKFLVAWNQFYLRFCFESQQEDVDDYTWTCPEDLPEYELEVIGNEYMNPELLEA